MKCKACGYTSLEWTVDVTKSYTGILGASNTVIVEEGDDYEQETIIKCPSCGEWQDGLSAEIEND